jgi:hypothetical protein
LSDAYNAITRKTRAPLPQSLGQLRAAREEALATFSGGYANSYSGEQWSRRIKEIDQVIAAARALPSFGRVAVSIPAPTVDLAYVSHLAGATESTILEFKSDLPFTKKRREQAQSELLKDIVAIANTITDEIGHLFYGKTEAGTLCGVTDVLDDADLQQWAENTIEPTMSLSLHNVQLGGVTVCLIVIRPAARHPHVAIRTISKDGPLYEGQVWFRRGTKNTVAATHEDLHRLFCSEMVGPCRFESQSDSQYQLLEDWFRSLRREPFLGRTTQKNQLIGQGYAIARHPLNSKEIVVGDVMLFLKPVSPTI